jgi:hypothetical protein
MLGRGTAAERLFQFIWHVRADEYSFAIGHFFRGLLVRAIQIRGKTQRPKRRCCRQDVSSERAQVAECALQREKSVSRILYSDPRVETSAEISHSRSEI